MPDSPAQDAFLYPFGALTGVIPIDATFRQRRLGNLRSALAASGPCLSDVNARGEKQWK